MTMELVGRRQRLYRQGPVGRREDHRIPAEELAARSLVADQNSIIVGNTVAFYGATER
jgi:hypothetical protein